MREGLLRVFSIKQGSILTIVLFLALVGCVSAEPTAESTIEETKELVTSSSELVNEVIISVTSPAENTPPPSATPTTLPTATLEPTQTATLMPTRTTAPTAILTSVPTLTPLSTIHPQQRGQMYTELMRNNGGCELPCWWGFYLGNTLLDEIRQFYATFDAYITEQDGGNDISILEALFVDPQIESGEQIRHSFVAQDGRMIEAEIQLYSHPDYQIEPILQQLGQPSEIWIWTIPEPYQGILPVRLRLYFPEQGVFVVYGSSGVKIDNMVNICFDVHGGATIHLWDPAIWDPNGRKGIVERSNESSSIFALEGHPINEVSNWDVEQFFTILTDPAHSECLQTPSDLWTPP